MSKNFVLKILGDWYIDGE